MRETIRRDAIFINQLEQFVASFATVALLVGILALCVLLA